MAEYEEDNEPVYGSTEGPNSTYITLISSDEHKFVIKRELCLLSSTIKDMLNGPNEVFQNDTNYIKFKSIPSHILHTICLYFAYRGVYKNNPMNYPEFEIPQECSLDILKASTFLNC